MQVDVHRAPPSGPSLNGVAVPSRFQHPSPRVTEPTPSTTDVRPPPPPELLAPGVLVPAFVLMIVVGFALFARGAGTAAGNELSKHQAVFAAVNAGTLTGFQQARTADRTAVGQTTLLALMIGGTLFSLVGGGLAVVRIARLPYRDRTVAAAAIACVVLAGAIGALAGNGPGRSSFEGAYQAISAFGNCGLYIGQLPSGGDPRVMWLLLPLAILGSLGLPVVLDLCRLRLSTHTRRVLTASAAAYLLLLLALVPLIAWRDPPPLAESIRALAHGGSTFGDAVRRCVAPLRTPLLAASREAINARSLGFPFQFVTSLPAASTVVLLVAMVIGGAPGGTAGGVKVTTVTVLLAGVRNAIVGRPSCRKFGLAVGWLGTYLALLLTATVCLVLADPELPVDRVLFLATSALGNVGLSHDPVSPSAAGMYVLSITMLAGRILPVLLLWTIADRMPDVTDAIG